VRTCTANPTAAVSNSELQVTSPDDNTAAPEIRHYS
jgi:hypothetical protein